MIDTLDRPDIVSSTRPASGLSGISGSNRTLIGCALLILGVCSMGLFAQEGLTKGDVFRTGKQNRFGIVQGLVRSPRVW